MNKPTHKPLTRKERAFVNALKNPKTSKTEAYLQAYNVRPNTKKTSIYKQAIVTSQKPHILHELKKYDVTMQQRLAAITDDFSSEERWKRELAYNAITDTLDRLHGKATQKSVSANLKTIDDLLDEE